MNNEPDYETGVQDERSRCIVVCEYWKRSSYIDQHYGPIDAVGMAVLQKVVEGIEKDIRSGVQPNV